ncbi:MAG TPA: hypothetical protein VK646_11545 [Actinomycetota bacterium]|nr:hypothetical protein [Actinomycetota bacterium]
MSDVIPPRPDDGAPGPDARPAPGSSRAPGVIVAIVVSCAVALLLFAVLIIAAVTFLGRAADDQFRGVQFCLNHPNHPSCTAPTP